MTENQFKFDRDTVATNLKTPIVYDDERMSIGEVLSKLNELAEEKKELQFQCNHLQEEANEFHRASRENANMVGQLKKENKELKEENEQYKSIFFKLVETALTDKNCRELYCKGILDIFNKANSLNQAREMIKEHLE